MLVMRSPSSSSMSSAHGCAPPSRYCAKAGVPPHACTGIEPRSAAADAERQQPLRDRRRVPAATGRTAAWRASPPRAAAPSARRRRTARTPRRSARRAASAPARAHAARRPGCARRASRGHAAARCSPPAPSSPASPPSPPRRSSAPASAAAPRAGAAAGTAARRRTRAGCSRAGSRAPPGSHSSAAGSAIASGIGSTQCSRSRCDEHEVVVHDARLGGRLERPQALPPGRRERVEADVRGDAVEPRLAATPARRKRSSAFHARSIASCTASSASTTEPSMR